MCSVPPDWEAQVLVMNASLKRVFTLLRSRGLGKYGGAKKASIFERRGLKLLVCVLLSKCFLRSVWRAADFGTGAASSSPKAWRRFWSFDSKL